jgi:penicillin V acylase-like amidase (Ntn superfamily)
VPDGLVVVNKRGVEKIALTDDNPARWTSRYGSVTFNQYGREFPSGGMNEKGLVVELMWLDDTQYPAPDARGGLPTLQWIQYQLDRCATVDEVVATDTVVRITSQGSARIHFLVADAGGACAAVEYLGGKMVVHRGGDMPCRALTNDTYEKSLAYVHDGGALDGVRSLPRFARAVNDLKKNGDGETPPVAAAFALLDDVAQGDYTQWSIVYEIGKRRIVFRTHLSPELRWVDLGALDFACGTPVQVDDVNETYSGDLTARFAPYSHELNQKLVDAAFSKTPFLSAAPQKERDEMASYPERTTCAR